jgi:hypothetical protein
MKNDEEQKRNSMCVNHNYQRQNKLLNEIARPFEGHALTKSCRAAII